jgi:hypothetical protein
MSLSSSYLNGGGSKGDAKKLQGRRNEMPLGKSWRAWRFVSAVCLGPWKRPTGNVCSRCKDGVYGAAFMSGGIPKCDSKAERANSPGAARGCFALSYYP